MSLNESRYFHTMFLLFALQPRFPCFVLLCVFSEADIVFSISLSTHISAHCHRCVNFIFDVDIFMAFSSHFQDPQRYSSSCPSIPKLLPGAKSNHRQVTQLGKTHPRYKTSTLHVRIAYFYSNIQHL